MNNSQKLLLSCRTFYRQMSSDVGSPRYSNMLSKQKQLGLDSPTPVHLKGGFGDKALFGTTLLLTAAGLGLSLETFWILTFGKNA